MTGFRLKRVIGGLNWKLRRHRWHLRSMADALVADIRSFSPTQVALTGDLVNFSAIAEFEPAAKWLAAFGSPDWLSFVPGNHDAYVRVPWEMGLSKFAPYMTGSMAIESAWTTPYNQQAFPYVRFKGNLALIGITTAVPQNLRSAGGSLGPVQLQRLADILPDLRRKGCYRCIMIHHPPLPGLATARKALQDAAALQQLLETAGAELVLHGHNHRNTLNWVDSRTGKIPVVGVASASMAPGGPHDAASWNLFEIGRDKGQWHTHMIRRTYDPALKTFADAAQYTLSP